MTVVAFKGLAAAVGTPAQAGVGQLGLSVTLFND
jgi:hypothetical protein